MDGTLGLLFGSSGELWHGLLVSVGIALGVALAMLLRRAQNESMWDIPIVALPSLVLGMLCGRIYYCHFAQKSLPDDNSIFNFTDGGYALYGAMLAAGLVVLAFCAFMKKKLGPLLDAAAPAAMLMITIGRLSSIFTGDDVGINVSGTPFEGSPFTVFNGRINADVIAVYIFEVIAGQIILALLLGQFLAHKKKGIGRNGDVFLMFLLLYGCTQTLFESMRTDTLFLVSFGFLKISQAVSIILALVAFVIFSVRGARKNGVAVTQLVLWITSLIFLGVAFWMQFNLMDDVLFVRNTSIIGICLLCFTLIGIFIYCRAEQKSLHAPTARRRARPYAR